MTMEERLARYQRRLEIDRCSVLINGEMVDHIIPDEERDAFPDGITARDLTIACLERELDIANAARARLGKHAERGWERAKERGDRIRELEREVRRLTAASATPSPAPAPIADELETRS